MLNPPVVAGLLPPPNKPLPPLPPLAPPNGEAAWPPALAPNSEPDGAVLVDVLPNSPPAVLAGAGTADRKRPPDDGALDAGCPSCPPPPLDGVVVSKEKVGLGFEGSVIVSWGTCSHRAVGVGQRRGG